MLKFLTTNGVIFTSRVWIFHEDILPPEVDILDTVRMIHIIHIYAHTGTYHILRVSSHIRRTCIIECLSGMLYAYSYTCVNRAAWVRLSPSFDVVKRAGVPIAPLYIYRGCGHPLRCLRGGQRPAGTAEAERADQPIIGWAARKASVQDCSLLRWARLAARI